MAKKMFQWNTEIKIDKKEMFKFTLLIKVHSAF